DGGYATRPGRTHQSGRGRVPAQTGANPQRGLAGQHPGATRSLSANPGSDVAGPAGRTETAREGRGRTGSPGRGKVSVAGCSEALGPDHLPAQLPGPGHDAAGPATGLVAQARGPVG